MSSPKESPNFYIEVGPLQEGEATGIAVVTSGLAKEALADKKIKGTAFIGRAAVPDAVLRETFCRNGHYLNWFMGRSGGLPLVPAATASMTVGIYPNVKTAHRLFDYEAVIVHDMSVFTVPHFHRSDTVNYHAELFLRDALSSDLIVCVSTNTQKDILSYFPEIPESRTMVSHLGVEWPPGFEKMYDKKFGQATVEPYILILGTLEPRKNIRCVLEMLSKKRTLLKKYRFVFVGRSGWGKAFKAEVSEFKLHDELLAGRIVHSGYVDNFAKYCLYRSATAVLYPSLFEGFGLPVLEALSVGASVITTRSSSIPEVGGDAVRYFDPFKEGSLYYTLCSSLNERAKNGPAVCLASKRQANNFSWNDTYTRIRNRVLLDLGYDVPLSA